MTNDFIKKAAEQVKNEEFRKRLEEDLVEHFEDRTEDGEPGAPEAVMGDAALIARQVNAPATRAVIGPDVMIAGIVGLITLILASIMPSFSQWNVMTDVTDATLGVVAAGFVIGLVTWSLGAFVFYLALHRRYVSHHGVSVTWFLLMTVAFIAPWVFSLVTESIFTFMNPGSWMTWGDLMRDLLARGMLLAAVIGAGYIVVKYMTIANKILTPSRKLAPFALAGFLVLGVTASLVITDTGPAATAFLPFIIPPIALYALWMLLCYGAGALAMMVGLPLISGWWITAVILVFAGVVYPLYRLVRRKTTGWALRLLAGVVMPLFVMIPFLPQDNPRPTWNVPELWNWDELERRQLNITYPWNSVLMRQDEGANIHYAAQIEEGVVKVHQDRSRVITVTREGVTTDRNTETLDWSNDETYLGELPEGFACNDKPLEELSDTHGGSTGPLGMFGMSCRVLSYNGHLVGMIPRGGLIDLDLADDGLLAVSINMGSYDPTYVYVVDIAELLQ